MMAKSYPIRNGDGTVTLQCWLTFSKDRVERMTLLPPATGRTERRIKVNLTYPASLFSEPEMQVNVVLDGDPEIIDQRETIYAVREAIEAIPGVVMKLEGFDE